MDVRDSYDSAAQAYAEHLATELGAVFQQMRRVLMLGGLALLSFHIGDEVVHVDELYGSVVSLDFRFHPSRRCYLLARAV